MVFFGKKLEENEKPSEFPLSKDWGTKMRRMIANRYHNKDYDQILVDLGNAKDDASIITSICFNFLF